MAEVESRLRGPMGCTEVTWLASPALAQEPPATVTTMVARYDTWQDKLEAVGSVRAVRGGGARADTSVRVWLRVLVHGRAPGL